MANESPNRKHPALCQCQKCLQAKITAFRIRMRQMYTKNPPLDIEQTVPVRAHWRRQKNHLSSQPELKALVLHEVRALLIKNGGR